MPVKYKGRQFDITFPGVRFVRPHETFTNSIPSFEQAWL
jgi:hypothetical protein